MALGSPVRAQQDSVASVLRRRLPRLDTPEHLRYIEIECARMVETLRSVRDTYRAYLGARGCTPLAEMYWVVFRYGVKDWAIMVLRRAVFDYIAESRIDTAQWEALFSFSGPLNDFLPSMKPAPPSHPFVQRDRNLMKTISALLPQTVFDEVLTGGPFGRDAQIWFTRSFPGRACILGQESIFEAAERRVASWDAAQPWTEGLARLFDSAQEEIIQQYEALGADGRQAEARLGDLSQFHRIAYKHLMSLSSGEIAHGIASEDRWPTLLRELDEAGIKPDQELRGIAKDVLTAMRRKGVAIVTWKDCYSSTSKATLEDGKNRTLRRETTHAIQNAAAKAASQLAKIWSRELKPRSSPKSKRKLLAGG